VDGGGGCGQRSRLWRTSSASREHEGQGKHAENEATPYAPSAASHTEFTSQESKWLTNASAAAVEYLIWLQESGRVGGSGTPCAIPRSSHSDR
jgi:hypothetical protein